MLSSKAVKRLIALAIEEDFGQGDVTSELTITPNLKARAEIFTRDPIVFCGQAIPKLVFSHLGWKLEVESLVNDGDSLQADQVICKLSGNARELLCMERTILNFLQRLSGVSTFTSKAMAESHGMILLDTRKTTPGWRALEKYAVRVGGAKNHRYNLADMVLVKDNHIDANEGNLSATLEKVFKGKPLYTPVEVEVRTEAELKQALNFDVQAIMLDNFKDQQIVSALELIKKSAKNVQVEVSGGVKPADLERLSKLGVRCVSSSSFVTKSTWVDISMQIYV